MKIEPKNLEKVSPEVKKIAEYLKDTEWVTPYTETEKGLTFQYVRALCRHEDKRFMIDFLLTKDFEKLSKSEKSTFTNTKILNENNEFVIDFSLKCAAARCECQNCPLVLASYYKTLEQLKSSTPSSTNTEMIIQAVETDEKALLDELEQMMYHDSVKKELREVIKIMKYVRICRENHLETPKPHLNLVLTMNPGMNNYAIEKFINKVALTMKLVTEETPHPRYLLTSKGEFLYPRSTRINVLNDLSKWEHQSPEHSDTAAKEKRATLIKNVLKDLEDRPAFFMTIIRGTESEVRQFFQENPKLNNHSTWLIHVPDLTNEQLWEQFELTCEPYNYQFEEGFKEAFFNFLNVERKRSPYQNLDFVKYLFHTTMMNEMLESNGVHSARVLEIGHLPFKEQKGYDLEEKLSRLIGMEEVKENLRDLEAYLRYNKRIAPLAIKSPVLNLHMLFTGNPGTGKTTVARIVAELLYELGYLRENKCIEVERQDLVAGYLGQTALKTGKVLESAKGGVLFIDEAYSLAQNERDWFGAEAIATLIKSMEDDKDELVVIFAGYQKEMQTFIDANSGIASRLGYRFNISDYTEDELLAIAKLRFKEMGYTLHEETTPLLLELIKEGMATKNFGNARFVVNLIQQIILRHAKRNHLLSTEELSLISPQDLISKEELKKTLNTKSVGLNPIGFNREPS